MSATPGKTREINFFDVNGEFLLVDLPGYGYARVSKTQRATWRPLIEGYLRTSAQLRGVVQLIDSRHDPSADDLTMLEFLAELEVPTLLVLTKADKLRPRDLPERVRAIADAAGVDQSQLIPFSTVTGNGRNELAEALVELLAQPAWRSP